VNLLARYAECIFWMARYMERAENIARLLDVHETFARDTRGATNWMAIIQLNADEKAFFSRYDRATAESVAKFYTLDASNGNSLVSVVRMARENARVLRPWISTEMWTQINVFYNRLLALTQKEVETPGLSRVCQWVKEGCQTHYGITEGTFYRDQGWYFYQMGKYIERADQTTRLVDIKYHTLLPSPLDVGSTLDVSQWTTVLRCAAGYHAFRRVYPRGMTPATVAGFLLFNEGFPRSVVMCHRQLDGVLGRMRSRYNLRRGAEAMEMMELLQGVLFSRGVDDIIRDGLHEYLDGVQCKLSDLTTALGAAFFGHEQTPVEGQAQAQ